MTAAGRPLCAQPLHEKLDAALDAARIGPASPPAGDAAFLRRAWLALTGMPPAAQEARIFLHDPVPRKRERLIARLTGSAEFTRHMAVLLDVMLMERRAEAHTKAADWRAWLEKSLAAGKPWDQLVREMLSADGSADRGAARWMLERQAEPNLLTRDAGRLFLGRDLACAQCHDHPRVEDYTQREYHGVLAFFGRTSLFQPDTAKPALVAESATGDVAWTSVFTKISGSTRPRLPDAAEVNEPVISGDLWTVPPNEKDKNVRAVPRQSRRAFFAGAAAEHPAFRRNIANRLWGMVMGRGLVEPPDMLHSDNAPVHPAVLDVAADGIAAMKFDLRSFVQELALTKAFAAAFDPVPAAPAEREAIQAKLPSMDAETAKLKEAASQCGLAFTAAVEAVEAAHSEARPVQEEWKKAAAAHAELAKAAAAAAEEMRKAEEKHAALAAALAKLKAAAEAGAAAVTTAPEDKDLAAAAKIFLERSAKLTGETTAAATEHGAKKAAADSKAAEVEKARVAAEEKKAAAGVLLTKIAAAEKGRDEADAAKRTARAAAAQAQRQITSARAVVHFADTATPESTAAYTAAAGASFDLASLSPQPPEQLAWSMLRVTGMMDAMHAQAVNEWDAKNPPPDDGDMEACLARDSGIAAAFRAQVKPQEDQFVRLFANGAGQPQNDFFATADQVLYFENAGALRGWGGPLAARLAQMQDDAALAEELYLSVLTRRPAAEEAADIAALLKARPADQRPAALADIIQALLCSTEFRFRH